MKIKSNIGRSFFAGLGVLISLAVHAELPAVSTVYETSVSQHVEASDEAHHKHKASKSQWYFWRSAKQVEVLNEQRDFGEKWTRTDKGIIFYQAIYHDKKFILDFQPVDLKLLGQKTNWETQSTLVSSGLLAQLKKTSTSKFKQYKKVSYEGLVSGVHYKVEWLPELKIPYRIEKHEQNNKRIVTQLSELNSFDKIAHKPLDSEEYEAMDYSDIGDNESHPIVANLQNNKGISYFHDH